MYKESYFDGGLFSYIGHVILATLITVFTLGICAPWGMCILYNWKVKHTVIDGHRLYFDGTFGIYSFWLNIKLTQWITKHTHHVN